MVFRSPWFKLSLVLFIALLARLSLGATKQTTPSNSSYNRREAALLLSQEAKETPWELLFGSGLVMTEGTTGWSAQLGLLAPIARDASTYAGMDFGFTGWSLDSRLPSLAIVSNSVTGLQLLATGIHRFEILHNRSLHPFVGVSVGPNIRFNRLTTTLSGTVTNESDLAIELLLRVGMHWTVSRSVGLQIEPKMGILKEKFIFLPTVQMAVSL